MTTVAEALRSPYKGLSAFDDLSSMRSSFRSRSTKRRSSSPTYSPRRLTVLYGPSGVGKSSLLRAGVVRSLRSLAETNRLPSLTSAPGRATSGRDRRRSRGALADEFGGDPGDASGDLPDRLDAWTAALGCDLLLIFDQFEELFLYHAAGGLLDLLPELVSPRASVSTSRSGFATMSSPGSTSSRLASRASPQTISDSTCSTATPPARPCSDRSSATTTLKAAAVTIEPALVESILGEVSAGRIDSGMVGRGAAVEGDRTRIETPYLQLVLQRLWEVERERRSDVLRLSTLASLGGAQQIVEDHLERAMAALTPREQDVAAGMFDHLVTPSGAKIAHGVTDLAPFAHVDAAELEPVLHSLARERILRPTGDNGHAGDRYEIYHDVLAGAVLAWSAKHDAERALASERVESRRRQRRLAVVAGISLAAFALMAVLTIYAYSQRNKANHQTAIARVQSANATHQTAIANTQRFKAIQAAHVRRLRRVELSMLATWSRARSGCTSTSTK